MINPIRIYISDDQTPSVPYVEITDDTIRAILDRVKAMPPIYTCQEYGHPGPYVNDRCEDCRRELESRKARKNSTPETALAAPVDDEATVQAILAAAGCSTHDGQEEALDIIAAIRRGEVPGLTTTAALDALREELLSKDEVDLVSERDALKAEVGRLRADSLQDGEPWQVVMVRANTEIDRLRAEVEHWKYQYSGMASAEKAVFSDCDRIRSERNATQAAHAEAVALLRRFEDVRGHGFMRADQQQWVYDKDAYLAKHGGGK